MPAYRPISPKRSVFHDIVVPMLGGAFIGLVLTGSLIFITVNLALRCETWQRELWTAHQSCWYPFMEEWTPPK